MVISRQALGHWLALLILVGATLVAMDGAALGVEVWRAYVNPELPRMMSGNLALAGFWILFISAVIAPVASWIAWAKRRDFLAVGLAAVALTGCLAFTQTVAHNAF